MSFRRGGRGGVGNGRPGGPRDMDRGRGGGRDSGPPMLPPRGGDRLSNHTSDASMANARIFVGNLPTNDPRMTKELLEESFGQYGHILGISILKGFGFIQYAEEISADNAIRGSQNVEILAHRMDVKPVKTNKDGMTPVMGPTDPAGYRDRSPIRRREFDMPREPDMMMRGPMDRGSRDFDGRDQRDWQRDLMEPYPAPAEPYLDRERDMRAARDPYPPPPMGDQRAGFGPAPRPGGMQKANDVEIVVSSKMGPLRLYAERIERRIRELGLMVDVLFPREDIPLRDVLSDLASRGTLYGIVLTPVNQEHGSITLNVFFGQPEEHRNMPVEDAFDLLTSSFRRQQQQQRQEPVRAEQQPAARGPAAAAALPEAHPPAMQTLINLLQENRPMTAMEYDRLIRYLGDRRDRQMADVAGVQPYQGGYSSGNAATPGDNPLELQQRILSILNSSGGGGGAGGPAPVPVPPPASAGVSGATSWTGAGMEAAQQPDGKALDMQSGPMKHYQQASSQRPQQQSGYYNMGNKRF